MTTPTGILFTDPNAKPLSPAGKPQAGCAATFYLTGTTTPADVYSDGDLTVSLGNVVTADAAGEFVQIYMDPTLTYRVILKTAGGATISDTDPYVVPGFNAATAGQTLFPITPAETAAGLTIVNFAIPPYPVNVLRYGVVPNDVTQAANNTTTLQTLFSPLTAGPTGKILFPNTTGADVYYVGGVIPCRAGIHIDACGSTISLGQAGSPVTGISTDTNSGLFMAANDFSFENGTINIFWATGVSVASGAAFQFGFRGSDTARWPLNPVYDSLLAMPMGGIRLKNVRINTTMTGAGLSSGSAITMIGGLQGVYFENIYITGNGTLPLGIEYEFGWATSGQVGDPGLSSRQTSHMHDVHFTNINVTNMDNSAVTSAACRLTGAYSAFVDGFYGSGVSNVIVANPGEAMYFRPWAGVDDVGAKQEITLRNITGENFATTGINIDGTFSRTANSSYLQHSWQASTAYVLDQTVINGGNMYVVTTPGTSASSGGPTGTVSGITDGTVIWRYVSLRANTDLLNFSLDGFALGSSAAAVGVQSSAGYAHLVNGNVTGCLIGVLLTEECTRFTLDGLKLYGNQQSGIEADFTASAIWSPARLKKGTIRNCFIAANSAVGAGTFEGIQIKNFDGLTVENCRFGDEAAYSFADELTQGNAMFLSATSGCANLRVVGCRVGGAVGGVGFANNSSTANQGNIVQGCTFNASGTNPIATPLSGAWMSDMESATAVVVASSTTITTSGLKTSRVNPAGSVTGMALQAGSYQGQEITVINESSNSVTFAASGTSHVADGTSDIIAALNSRKFTWDTGTSLWYPNK